MKKDSEKTTAEYAKEAIALLDAMTPKQRKQCAREIGIGFRDAMRQSNYRPTKYATDTR